MLTESEQHELNQLRDIGHNICLFGDGEILGTRTNWIIQRILILLHKQEDRDRIVSHGLDLRQAIIEARLAEIAS